MPCSILAGVLPVVLAAVGAAQELVTSAEAGSVTTTAVVSAATESTAARSATVQITPAAECVFTEADLLSMLDESHPAMVARSAELKRAQSQLEAAGRPANPELAFLREDPSGPTEQTEWTVSWRLPDADREPRLGARRHEVEALAARLEQDRLDLRLQLKTSYAEWAFATERFELLAAQAERIAALADREAERARGGEVSGLQARRLRLAADRLRFESELSAAEMDRARAAVLGWHPELPVSARPWIPDLSPVPSSAQDHPRVRAAAQALEAARLERRAEDRFIRSPELTVGWLRQEAELSSLDGPTVGLSWSVPLFTRQRAKKAGAEARLLERRSRLEIARRQVGSAREGHAAAYERLAAAVKRAKEGLAEVKPMLDATEAAFQLGETSLTDLLETYRSAGESQLAYLELHQEALAALRQLERATGVVGGGSSQSTDRSVADPHLGEGADIHASTFERYTP